MELEIKEFIYGLLVDEYRSGMVLKGGDLEKFKTKLVKYLCSMANLNFDDVWNSFLISLNVEIIWGDNVDSRKTEYRLDIA